MQTPKRILTGLAATATAGMLVLGTPGLAQAAHYDKGKSDRERTAQDGTGDAEAKARATDDGKLWIHGEAEGGDSDNPLVGAQAAVASSVASVKKSVPVANGTYRVVIHYAGAQGTDRDRQDGDARADLFSTVRYDGEQLQRVRELDSNRSKEVVAFVIDIPEGSSGRLTARAALRGSADAPAAGDYGRYSGSVRDVSFKVTRIND